MKKVPSGSSFRKNPALAFCDSVFQSPRVKRVWLLVLVIPLLFVGGLASAFLSRRAKSVTPDSVTDSSATPATDSRLPSALVVRKLPACSPGSPISLSNIEDFDWRGCPQDLTTFWAEMNISPEPFGNSSRLGAIDSIFGDLTGDGADERILRVEGTRGFDRFVVLTGGVRGDGAKPWRALTHVDAAAGRVALEGRVVSNGRSNWLVINHIEDASGPGIFQESERWLEWIGGQMVEVWSLPVAGVVNLQEGSFEYRELRFAAEVVRVSFEKGDERIEVQAHVTCGTAADSQIVINKRLSFSRRDFKRPFVLDEEASALSRDGFRALFDVGSLSVETFVHFFREDLRVLRKGSATPGWYEALRKYSPDARFQSDLSRIASEP